MEINSIDSSKPIAEYQKIDSIPVLKNKEIQETEIIHGADKVSISDTSEKMMKYVRQVKEMEEVRADLVNDYKNGLKKIDSRPPSLAAGLISLIGNSSKYFNS